MDELRQTDVDMTYETVANTDDDCTLKHPQEFDCMKKHQWCMGTLNESLDQMLGNDVRNPISLFLNVPGR